ncbi:hypothetical protein J5N97_003906 [Dioscorea zingiberensis]|uniref:Retrotransposon gag domain-containing protein n=1 Tax=Dioscorea zingiberensis TaxID=325984 RepID=A0A9D5D523_9LILI|nr:hypothetical protein J5N97_003906 [Dioscorea zingiberensis]
MRAVVGLVRDQRQSQHQQPPPPPPPQPHQRTIAEFKRTGPPPFEGTTDPDVAEKWIDEMEKAFDVMECTEEEKLRFATYMLQGSAYNWWKGEVRVSEGRNFDTWDQLRTAFFSKYFPRSKVLELERQFLRLKQGTMTVDEYEMEFDKLSRFAAKFVDDDESRAHRFQDGLQYHIRKALAPLHLTSYAEVVGRAKSLDVVCREGGDQKKGHQKKRDRSSRSGHSQFTGKNSKPKVDSRALVASQTVSRPPHQQPQGTSASAASSDKRKCSICGKAHLSIECWGAT